MTNTKHSSVFRGSISYIAKLTLPSSQLLCLVLCDSLGPCGNNLPCQVSCVVDFPDLVLLSTSGFLHHVRLSGSLWKPLALPAILGCELQRRNFLRGALHF